MRIGVIGNNFLNCNEVNIISVSDAFKRTIEIQYMHY